MDFSNIDVARYLLNQGARSYCLAEFISYLGHHYMPIVSHLSSREARLCGIVTMLSNYFCAIFDRNFKKNENKYFNNCLKQGCVAFLFNISIHYLYNKKFSSTKFKEYALFQAVYSVVAYVIVSRIFDYHSNFAL